MYALPSKNIEYIYRHNGNTRTWLLDMLEMTWHQPQTSIVGLIQILQVELQFVIQIKICAEYQDMLPRPRLVCQEPGLRPIGRSPGIPDKSSRGLGSISRYSAQILICL